jgi:hypothetical protein
MGKKKTEEKKIEYWHDIWTISPGFPEENIDLLDKRFTLIETWEAKRRKQGGAFNEQYCADVYAVAMMMTKDDSFKGKFDPEALYQEMYETMKDIRKGKTDYSLYDESKMVCKVMENHRKKNKC